MSTLTKEYLDDYRTSPQYKLFHEYRPATYSERLIVTRPPLKKEIEEKAANASMIHKFAEQKANPEPSKTSTSNVKISQQVARPVTTQETTKEDTETMEKSDNSLDSQSLEKQPTSQNNAAEIQDTKKVNKTLEDQQARIVPENKSNDDSLELPNKEVDESGKKVANETTSQIQNDQPSSLAAPDQITQSLNLNSNLSSTLDSAQEIGEPNSTQEENNFKDTVSNKSNEPSIPRYSGPNLVTPTSTSTSTSSSANLELSSSPSPVSSSLSNTNSTPSSVSTPQAIIHPGIPKDTEKENNPFSGDADIFSKIRESLNNRDWLEKIQEVHLATIHEIEQLPIKRIKLKSIVDNKDSYMPLNSTLFNILSSVIIDDNGLITFTFRNGGHKSPSLTIVPESWVDEQKQYLLSRKCNYYYSPSLDLVTLSNCFKTLAANISSTETFIQYFIKYVPIIFEEN
ncbi:hypothetical protein FP435_00040 (plasmid) [Lactobacillus sp. PV037]|uniref:hypothetical protein n=1 Tax=Lactobacillus sp. PV037 TaxID=2594496 RepID=UPI00223F35BF|nr:hypothetical protein [Lactobacillus sp. PV037]QNQ82930.1 hypothetical protein FP435_00040 [Lactobacillus sp. PV037]